MSRKDYKAIAEELRKAHDYIVDELDGNSLISFWITADAVMRALAADNPHFDRVRFTTAIVDKGMPLPS